MMETIKVIFRRYKDDDIIALFPEEMEDPYCPYLCSSYMHVGQHGGAAIDAVIDDTLPAREPEYRELKEELEDLGYKLRVVKKYSRKMFKIRESKCLENK